jgi:Pyruvate/2-oxoacid:ferredoxin oxidoreductase gamma subunit
VEILSPCPVGWKMTPTKSRSWIKETMEGVFEVKNFRNREDFQRGTGRMPLLNDSDLQKLLRSDHGEEIRKGPGLEGDCQVKIAGFGGQGVMSAGVLLASAAIGEGLEASWLPSYGPEMRGGTANASVVISNKPVGSPVVDVPTALLAMNGPSLDSFEDNVVPGGLIIVNSSLVNRRVRRTDVKTIYAPASAMAAEAGFLKGANIVMLALYLLETGVPGIETLKLVIPRSLKKKEMIDVNLALVKVAEEFHGA